MANVNVQDLVTKAIEAITPTLAEALAKALANMTEQTDEKTKTDAPSKGKFRRSKHIDSTFEMVENEINVCEYSDKSIAIWGDTKDKTELIDYIKHMGQHDKHKANFVTPLSAISSRPVGWTINKVALDANGGMEEFLDSIQSLGFNVVLRESVKDVFEANKKAREKDGKTDAKTDAPTKTDAPSKGKGKDKPSIAPTDEQKASKPQASKPQASKPQVKLQAINDCNCYDNCKEGDGYKIVKRGLVKRGAWYYAQGEKGAAIYALIGKDVDSGSDIFVNIAKVKGNITTAIMPEFKTWDSVAKDVVKAVNDGTQKASNAIMYAFVDAGDQDAVNAVWDKMQAA